MDSYKLLLFAAVILYINRSIPERYLRYEGGKARRNQSENGLRRHLLHLSGQVGERTARNAALAVVTLIWFAFIGFCAAVVSLYPLPLLRVVAGLVGGLATIAYLRDVTTVWSGFVAWCYCQEDDILLITRGCWEVILAGLVVVDSLFMI